MLNALSSTLKSDSDDQSRKAPPTIPSAVAFVLDRARPRAGSSRPTCSGTSRCSSRTKNEPSSAWCDEPEQREREEEQRHEREQREVGDHRREVRAAVGEELAQDRAASARTQYAQRRWMPRPGARRPDRDLVAGRGTSRSSTRTASSSASTIARRRPRRALRRRRRAARRARPRRCASARPAGSRSSRPRRSTGSVFVVRDGERMIAATTRPEPTVGLVFYDLKHCLRDRRGRRRRSRRQAAPEEGRCRRVRSSPGCCSRPARSRARCSTAAAPPASRERVDLYAEDGSMVSLAEGSPEAERLLPLARELLAARRDRRRALAEALREPPTSRATSCCAPAGAARTTSTSTASTRGPTCSRRSARRIAAAVASTSPTPSGSPRPSSAPSRSPPRRRSSPACRS